jgi:hypothetical protein
MPIKLNLSSSVHMPPDNNSKGCINYQASARREQADERAASDSAADIISQQTAHSDIPESAFRTLVDKLPALMLYHRILLADL